MGVVREHLLQMGIRTLRAEAEAILRQTEVLDEEFLNAVLLILSISGHVAVTGMGKSGHIGRKIAATLASTGTPAFFVHPAEASHGDLGMIGAKDALLTISNSGRTPELGSILNYSKRIGIPIIAITHDKESPLAKQSDICLMMRYENEACPVGCAPTTSTAVSLALGDALAMTLLEARGFTAKDFNEYHPGGSLGQKLLLVKNIMHGSDELPLVPLGALLPEVLLEMTGKGFGCAGVVDDHLNLQGIITDGDLRRHLNRGGGLESAAGEIMTSNPHIIEKDCPTGKALNTMQKNAITSLFVTEGRKPVGIVHMHDCLRISS